MSTLDEYKSDLIYEIKKSLTYCPSVIQSLILLYVNFLPKESFPLKSLLLKNLKDLKQMNMNDEYVGCVMCYERKLLYTFVDEYANNFNPNSFSNLDEYNICLDKHVGILCMYCMSDKDLNNLNNLYVDLYCWKDYRWNESEIYHYLEKSLDKSLNNNIGYNIIDFVSEYNWNEGGYIHEEIIIDDYKYLTSDNDHIKINGFNCRLCKGYDKYYILINSMANNVTYSPILIKDDYKLYCHHCAPNFIEYVKRSECIYEIVYNINENEINYNKDYNLSRLLTIENTFIHAKDL
jgi:hypothetical protein